MKVVIYSPFYFPEMISTGKYNVAVVEELVRGGAEVSVVCSHPLYPDWKPYFYNGAEPDWAASTNVLRGGGWMRYPKSQLLRRFILEIWFFFHCLWSFMTPAVRNADVHVLVFPPSLFALILILFKRRQSRLVGVVHDLQTVYLARRTGWCARLVSYVVKKVERLVFGACDRLIFLSSSMLKRAQLDLGGELKGSRVCFPFVTVNLNEDVNSSFVMDTFERGVRYISYSGALGEKQAPEQLMKFFNEILSEFPDWRVCVFSAGSEFEKARADSCNSRIFFGPLVPEKDLGEVLKRVDIQMIPQEENTSEGSLPSKLPNLIASGSRILAVTDQDSELGELLQGYPAGAVSEKWTWSELRSAFLALQAKERPSQEELGAWLKLFSPKGVVDSLIKW